ncbi:LOW QUALITY PROTEIN: reverse transcriptase [Phytophthora megakarya]|uniref:Reverse transcriptase n=1 Tax=Phytophthora megakarya TaxID=4795 RepID=A0A225W5C6_9STRA|nr:LOW QUALITY PROTEIN: reverse transcriptase [Phytophthora megakarya]
MNVADVNQQDWDRRSLSSPLKVEFAGTRPSMHDWDARTTLEAKLPVGSSGRGDSSAHRWRYHMQSQYRRPREAVNSDLTAAIEARAERHNERVSPPQD